jgi:hypothetical protein
VLIYCPYARHNGLANGLAGSWNRPYLPHSLAAFFFTGDVWPEIEIKIQKYDLFFLEGFQ